MTPTATPRPAPSRRRTNPIEPLEARAYFAAVSFAPAVSFTAGTAPIALASADFNGDGHADLAVADATTEKVNVFFGTGTGSFTAGPVLSLSAPPTAIITGDFNGDGLPDIAVAASPGNSNNGTTVTVFLNAGNGNFALGQQTTVETGVAPSEPIAIAAGDFNGDGHLDLVATDYTAGQVSVLIGTGTGAFAAPVTYNVGADPTAVAVGDFNGDGHLDVAVTATFTSGTGTSSGSDSPGLLVLNGAGNGQFSVGSETTLPTTGQTLAATDFLGVGQPTDLVVGNQNATATVLLNSGSGTFTEAAQPTTGAASTGVAVADLNLDGLPDIVSVDGGTATSSTGTDTVTVIPGAGGGTVGASSSFAVGSLPSGVAVADFNGDGKPDLAVANNGSGTVSILLNDTVVTPLATTTTLAVSPTATPAGSPVTLTATVTSKTTSPLTGEAEPTGTVSFYEGSALLGTVNVTGTTSDASTGVTTSSASLAVTALSVGSHKLTAKYAGDTAYAASGSGATTEVISATAGSGANLVASLVTVGLPSTVSPGEAGTVRVKLTNEGDETATGTLVNDLYLSTDAALDASDTAVTLKGSLARTAIHLAPNGSVTLSGTFAVPASTPVGSYLLLLDTDANGGVTQATGASNLTASTATYTVADAFGTVGGKPGVALAITSASGATATFKLSGAGTGTVTVGTDGVDVSLAGTTAGSAVTVTPDAGAAFTLHDLSATSAVGRIAAPAIGLSGGTLALGGGATAVTLGAIDGSLTAGAGVRSLSVGDWAGTGDVITVPWIGKLTVAGNLDATVDLSGAGAPSGVALASAKVSGATVSGTWSVDGAIGQLTITGNDLASITAGDIGTALVGGNLQGTLIAGDGTAGRIKSLRVNGDTIDALVAAGVSIAADGTPTVLSGGSITAITVLGTADGSSRFLAATEPKRPVLGGVVVDPTTDPRFLA